MLNRFAMVAFGKHLHGAQLAPARRHGFRYRGAMRRRDDSAQFGKRSSEFGVHAARALDGALWRCRRDASVTCCSTYVSGWSPVWAGRRNALCPFLKIEVSAMRRIRSWAGAAAGLTLLVAGLAMMDERVRYALVRLLDGEVPGGDIARAGGGMRDTGTFALQVLRDQSIEYAPLTLFAIGAMVLVFFMTRT
jgi:hypothetical protein